MGKLQGLAYFSIIMPVLTSNSVSMSVRMLYLSCVKIWELHCPAKTEHKLALGRVTQCQRVGAFIFSLTSICKLKVSMTYWCYFIVHF